MTDTASPSGSLGPDEEDRETKISVESVAADGDFPISGGDIKEVKDGPRRLNLKMNFKNITSPKKIEKGR